MNLTIVEKNAFEKLPENLKPFTKARIEPPVKSLPDSELKGKCLDIIGVAYAEQGQFGIEVNILTFQKECLFTELRTNSKFKELTISEVRNAFREGIRGESGPFFGMCTKTYHQFLKHYYEKPQRVEGMKQYLELMQQENKQELSPAEKREKNKQAVIWYFEEYKKNGKLGPGSYAIYDTLWSLGGLKFSAEERKDIRDKVESEYTKELELSRKKQRITANQLAELLLTFDTNPTLKGNLRKEALKRYFNSLIEKNINLSDVFK